MSLNAGDNIQLGTCILPGAFGTGDTVLRLRLGTTTLATNDDYSINGCGTRSFISYNVTITGLYSIDEGCYSTGACSGTVAYRITRLPAPSVPCRARLDCVACQGNSSCGWSVKVQWMGGVFFALSLCAVCLCGS